MTAEDQTDTDNTMELLNKKDNTKTCFITYHFPVNEEALVRVPMVTSSLHQIFLTVCASLSCLPFGLMLGWPSPTNPILLDQFSPIPITIDQSAMIAGFLMIGNAVGTPISGKGCLGSKFGIVLGVAMMIIGWILMWQSQNIFWLLGSRFLVGLGNAYTVGQLKIFIGNTCDENLKISLIKLINMYVYLGIIIIFSFGPFIDFRDTSIICLLISVVILFIVLCLPTTPTELIKSDKINDARKLIARIKPCINVNNEIKRISNSITNKGENRSLINLLKQADLRVNFAIFTIMVFCQQFSGAPSTMIYTQILFEESHCPNAEYIAIAYVTIFFITNIFGIFVMPKFNKKTVLICSTVSVIIIIVIKILVIHFKVNDNYWNYTSVVVMFLYIIAHTLGLGNIPLTLIPDLFPRSYHTVVTHFFIAFHSILALIITKIFQLLMTQYDVGVPFYLFLSISCFALFFICLVIPKTDKVENDFVEKKDEIKIETVN